MTVMESFSERLGVAFLNGAALTGSPEAIVLIALASGLFYTFAWDLTRLSTKAVWLAPHASMFTVRAIARALFSGIDVYLLATHVIAFLIEKVKKFLR